jgi:hypothetical protein
MKKGSLIICYKARKRAGSHLDQNEIRQKGVAQRKGKNGSMERSRRITIPIHRKDK